MKAKKVDNIVSMVAELREYITHVHMHDNNGVRDGGENVILSQAPLPSGVRLTGNQPASRYISYAPTGATRLASGAFQAGTLTVCLQSAGPTAARQIILSSTGRPRTVKTTLASCP